VISRALNTTVQNAV